MEEFIFRKARQDELEIVLEMLKQAALWLQEKKINYWQDWISPPSNFVNWIKRGFTQNEFFIVESQSKIVACFRLQWEDEIFWGKRENNSGYVHSFTVSRDLAGQGIGYRILDWVSEYCKDNGKQILRLDCGADNPGLKKYYEGYGFRAKGEITYYERMTLYEKSLV